MFEKQFAVQTAASAWREEQSPAAADCRSSSLLWSDADHAWEREGETVAEWTSEWEESVAENDGALVSVQARAP